MEFAFWLGDACSVAWGASGVWMAKNQALPADDPFVQAHLDQFSRVPPNAYSTVGRTFEQTPMSDERPAHQGRGRRNG